VWAVFTRISVYCNFPYHLSLKLHICLLKKTVWFCVPERFLDILEITFHMEITVIISKAIWTRKGKNQYIFIIQHQLVSAIEQLIVNHTND